MGFSLRTPTCQSLPRKVIVTARFFWMKTPLSKSNADAVADISALPPVNKADARPWKSVSVVCMAALHGVVPLQATNVEKKPVIGLPPCVCFSCPERVTNAGFEHETKPEMVAVPVGGSMDPNCVTLGAIESRGGARSRLNTRFAEGAGENDETSK